jgi:cytochrome bd-type quinol oxidase subunit 2
MFMLAFAIYIPASSTSYNTCPNFCVSSFLPGLAVGLAYIQLTPAVNGEKWPNANRWITSTLYVVGAYLIYLLASSLSSNYCQGFCYASFLPGLVAGLALWQILPDIRKKPPE